MFGRKRRKKLLRTVELLKTAEPDRSLTVDLGNGRSLKVGNAQHRGKRPYQEDSCGFSVLTDPAQVLSKGVLAVLADGMGGLAHGKEVSSMTVSGMIDWFNAPGVVCTDGEQMYRRAQEINAQVCARFSADGSIRAGSTLVSAMIRDGTLHWACVGDSRLYLYRNGRSYQINEDQDYLNRLLGEAIRERQTVSPAFTDPQKDVLVSCIGSENMTADVSRTGLRLQPGDKLLLCSDGVYNAIPASEIDALMQLEPQTAAESIEATVLAQGHRTQDNLTTVIISYYKEDGVKS